MKKTKPKKKAVKKIVRKKVITKPVKKKVEKAKPENEKKEVKEVPKKIFAEKDAETFLKKYLPIANSKVVIKIEKALELAKVFKYPVVLKIVSSEILHKTEAGAVKIAKNVQELQQFYNELLNIAKQRKLKSYEILLQEYINGRELIIGLKKDQTFGHVIVFGLGGIFVEVMKDVSIRVCPITLEDAEAMINELKSKDVLYGTRGEKKVNLKLLKEILVKVSNIAVKNKNISELDINPFMINERIGKVVDARIVFD